MRRLHLSAAAALIVFSPLSAIAEPAFLSAKQIQDKAYGSYPLVSVAKPIGPICYLEMEGYRMDLSLMCGPADTEGEAIASSSGSSSSISGSRSDSGSLTNSSSGSRSGSGSGRSGSSAGGPCDYPGQLDSAGRRCGKRAASEKAGGR